MSRITKQIAEDVSRAMTAEKRKAANELKEKFQQVVSEMAFERVPESVQTLFGTPDTRRYIVQRDSCQLTGGGFDYKWVNFPTPIPFQDNNNCLTLNEAQGRLLWRLEDSYKKAKLEVDNLKDEIYITLLYTLKTFKKVQDHFPEAFEHLPKVGTPTSLAINLDALRQKISK